MEVCSNPLSLASTPHSWVKGRMEDSIVKVISVKQSPLNALRWVLVLDCGHTVWVTARSRPQWKTCNCEHETCVQQQTEERNGRQVRSRD